MKIFRVLIPMLVLAGSAMAQINLTINSVDATAYQDIHVFFTVTDNSSKRILSFSPSDFTVVENGITRPVKQVSCPTPITPLQSIALVMDISYSMSLSNRIAYARNSAAALVRSLTVPPGIFGITTFNDKSYINLPFTSDTTAIQAAISGLVATGGGTDFLGAFMDPGTGAIDFTKNAAGLRTIIFITDAYQTLSTANEQAIIAAAKAASIKIYSMTMSPNTINYSLRRIALQTGGQWYENVTSAQQSDLTFQIIREQMVTYPPCELVYWTDGCDVTRSLSLTVKKNSSTATKSTTFPVDPSTISTLEASRTLVDFGVVPPGTPSDKYVTITARNRDILVQSIQPALTGLFAVLDYGGSPPPFTLAAGQSRTLLVRFLPIDIGRVSSELVMTSNASCTKSTILAGGAFDPHPLKLIQPNGGEKLFTGSLYFLKWTCDQSWHPIFLDYSTNAGSSWMNITQYAYNLNHNWIVPETPSNTCLALAYTRTARESGNDKTLIPYQPSEISDIVMTQDGSLLAVALANGVVKIQTPRTSTLVASLSGHTGGTNALCFSPDATMLATAGKDGYVRVWETSTGALIRTLSSSAQNVHACQYTQDGLFLIVADENAVDEYRVSDWARVWRQAGYSSSKSAMTVDPGSQWIASGFNNRVAILRFSDGGFIRYLDGHSRPVRALAVSDDGGHIASGGDDQTIIIWNTNTWQQDRTLQGHGGSVSAVTLTQYGLQAISTSLDRTVRIWDTRSGATLYSLTGHTDEVNTCSYSPGAGLIASGGKDKSIRLWGYRAPYADESDSLWSIISTVSSLSASHDPFDTLLCINDSSTRRFSITNIGNQAITLTNYDIQGSGKDAFSPVGAISVPRQLEPGDSLVFYITFKTSVGGSYQATLVFGTSSTVFPSLAVPIEGFKELAAMSASPDTINTPELYYCTIPSNYIATATNQGTVQLTIDTVMVSDPALLKVTRSMGRTISPGQIDTAYISVTPGSYGRFSGWIEFHAIPCDLTRRVIVQGVFTNSAPVTYTSPVDFGPTSVGDSSFRSIYIRNTTQSPMIIDTLISLPPLFTILYPITFPLTIPPMDSVQIEAVYTPITEGDSQGELIVPASQPCIDTLRVPLLGSSSRKPEINTQLYPFPVLLCPETSYCDTVLVLSNGGGEPLVVSTLHIAGADSSSFSFVPSQSLPLTIQPGTSQYIHIRFNPAKIGQSVATLTVISNALTSPSVVLPLAALKDSAGFDLSTYTIQRSYHHCDTPVLHTVTLRNTGNVDIVVSADTTALIQGLDITGSTSWTLKPGALQMVTFTIKDPGISGTSTVAFTATPCNVRNTLSIVDTYIPSLPAYSPSAISFGAIGAGTTAIDSLRITNSLVDTVRILSASLVPASGSASITGSIVFPLTLVPGQSRSIYIRYAPVTNDTLKSELVIVTGSPCRDTIRIPITGSSMSATAAVSVPAITARVGEVIRVPIRLDASSNLAVTGTRSFEATLVARKSVLWPMAIFTVKSGDSATFTADRTNEFMRVDIKVRQSITPTPAVMAELECLVLLGDTDRTDLGLEGFKWLNGQATTTSTSGSLYITGICNQGGMRFVKPSSSRFGLTAAPNPFNPRTVLTFQTDADGMVRLEINDVLGIKVATLVKSNLPAGKHTCVFDASEFPSGTYFVVLHTPTGSGLLRLLLEK